MDIVNEKGSDKIDLEEEKEPAPELKIQDNNEYEFMIPLSTTTKLKPFVDRYFVKYYRVITNDAQPGLCLNQYSFMHTNKYSQVLITLAITFGSQRLFMLGVAKEHEIIKRQLKIQSISFDCLTKGGAVDVKGKKKRKGRDL